MEYTTIIIETADLVTKGVAPMVVAGIASAIPGIAKGIGALFGRKRVNRNLKRREREQEARMRDVENLEFTNPFKDQQNAYEDWQVNLRSAQMQQQTASQILSQGLAAGSEIGMDPAALAQMQQNLLNRTNQRIQADIGQQEVMGQRLAAEGEMEKDRRIAEGQARLEDSEMGKRAALLGISNQQLAAATRAKAENRAAIIGGIGSAAGAAFSAFGGKLFGGGANAAAGAGAGAGTGFGGIMKDYSGLGGATIDAALNQPLPQLNLIKHSDRRLKKNIKLIGKSEDGLNIYIFEYINKIFGEGIYQGVMSDEIPQYAVINHTDGYDRVDYNKIDVEFKQLIK